MLTLDHQSQAPQKQSEMCLAVSDLIRQSGISEQTFYRMKKQYGGLQSGQVRDAPTSLNPRKPSIRHPRTVRRQNIWLRLGA
jgi:hypothetical protein